MTRFRFITQLAVLATTAIATVATAAPIYNVNMMAFRGSDGGSAAFLAIDNTAATAPVAFAGNRWNDVQVVSGAATTNAPNLIDSEGNASTVTFDIAAGVSSWSDPTFQLDAMKGYAFTTATDPVPMKLSGLTPGSKWILNLMSHGDAANQWSTFDLGGDVRTTANQDVRPETTWQDNVNYAGYLGVEADASGEINWTMARAGGASHAAFNGLQLVAIPEPASLGLLGALAAGCLAGIRRA